MLWEKHPIKFSIKLPGHYWYCINYKKGTRNNLGVLKSINCLFDRHEQICNKCKNVYGWILHTVRDFDEKTRQKEMLKTLKKLVTFASNRSTYSIFHNENRAVEFLRKKVLENGLSNSCTKNQVTPIVSFVNIEDLKLKTKILSAVK